MTTPMRPSRSLVRRAVALVRDPCGPGARHGALVSGESAPNATISLAVWESPLLRELGCPHGFSTRHGGVSEGAFDSLNLGLSAALVDQPGDLAATRELSRVEINITRFLAACGLDGRRAVRVRQVHGACVLDASEVSDRTDPADALVTASAGDGILIRTADCVPILLACRSTGQVAAVHAGWRGLVGGIIEQTLRRLDALGARPEHLCAAIGPSIGVDAYEVGEEVAAAFVARDLGDVIRRDRPKPHLDCHGAAHRILRRLGVPEESIDGEPLCTFARPDDFFSARRDGAISGRLAAAIGPATLR
jgi:polyphenol oxidase